MTHLIKHKNYMARFWQLVVIHESHRKAFEALENEYYEQYGINKYSSYPSFRAAKSRSLSKKTC